MLGSQLSVWGWEVCLCMCLCVRVHGCVFVGLGIFLCNYKKVPLCGGMFNAPYVPPYGAFPQTLDCLASSYPGIMLL